MTAPRSQRAAVLGTGTMAPGIAIAFAAAGFDVALWGRDPGRAEAARARAAELACFLEAEALAGPAEEVVARVHVDAELRSAAAAAVVVEAVAEDLAAKHEVLSTAEAYCSPEALIATNTSGLLVTDIAAALARPERAVAMHFWNPAHLMPIVEIAGGARTSPSSVKQATELARTLGKAPVVLQREVLGFLGTRMQQAVVREAIGLVQAGVASPEDVDLAVRTSFGIRFPAIGPLESTDLSGLDVIAAIHGYLLADLDRSTEPQPALLEHVGRGELGVKSGRGFYDWSSRDADEVVARRDRELVSRLRQGIAR
jgi:3-hydroxybutyryl-CoA dehydrogenase